MVIDKLADIRLKTESQLAGFAKGRDLQFILKLFDIGYESVVDLAPDEQLMKDYMKQKDWVDYEERFDKLMKERDGKNILVKLLDEGKIICLL